MWSEAIAAESLHKKHIGETATYNFSSNPFSIIFSESSSILSVITEIGSRPGSLKLIQGAAASFPFLKCVPFDRAVSKVLFLTPFSHHHALDSEERAFTVEAYFSNECS